ncbi:MAG: acetamidase/formamidase family protein, partial [Aggregatilineales bacterium]
TTLYLPIGVEGALFSTGDGHAAQGDGEVSVTAIECPMDNISLTFKLHDDMPLEMPQARVQGGYITMGVDEDLWKATTIALDAMVSYMMVQYDISKNHALALASVVVDMRITQIANGTLGVHAFLPDDAIQQA